jgi:hypothetical protein
MLKSRLAGRLTLPLLLLLIALPAAAQADDAFPLETRVLLAALDAAEEATEDFEVALNPSDSAATAPDAARRLRQRALEGAVEAARADLLIDGVAVLRVEGGTEAPLSDEEIELQGLLNTLQMYGDDLVEVEGCDEGEPPLNFDAIGRAAQPTFDRIRALVASLREGVAGIDEGEEQP